MSDLNNPPKVQKAGSKYVTDKGFAAIKDGIRPSRSAATEAADAALSADPKKRADHTNRKPSWLRVSVPSGAGFNKVKRAVRDNALATVCEESHCPNIGECWNNGTATIMLMGAVCTRACRFCAVDTGNPGGWLDHNEPAQAAETVRLMNLRYIVLTSVDRDDLSDGGAGHYAACIKAIKAVNPTTAVEALWIRVWRSLLKT